MKNTDNNRLSSVKGQGLLLTLIVVGVIALIAGVALKGGVNAIQKANVSKQEATGCSALNPEQCAADELAKNLAKEAADKKAAEAGSPIVTPGEQLKDAVAGAPTMPENTPDPTLKEIGLSPTGGIPDRLPSQDREGVLSWFNSPIIQRPLEFVKLAFWHAPKSVVKWVMESVYSGIKSTYENFGAPLPIAPIDLASVPNDTATTPAAPQSGSVNIRGTVNTIAEPAAPVSESKPTDILPGTKWGIKPNLLTFEEAVAVINALKSKITIYNLKESLGDLRARDFKITGNSDPLYEDPLYPTPSHLWCVKPLSKLSGLYAGNCLGTDFDFKIIKSSPGCELRLKVGLNINNKESFDTYKLGLISPPQLWLPTSSKYCILTNFSAEYDLTKSVVTADAQGLSYPLIVNYKYEDWRNVSEKNPNPEIIKNQFTTLLKIGPMRELTAEEISRAEKVFGR